MKQWSSVQSTTFHAQEKWCHQISINSVPKRGKIETDTHLELSIMTGVLSLDENKSQAEQGAA